MKTYRVTTEGDCEGRSTRLVGYYHGDKELIKKALSHKKYYSLSFFEVVATTITEETLAKQKQLKAKAEELEAELKAVEEQII